MAHWSSHCSKRQWSECNTLESLPPKRQKSLDGSLHPVLAMMVKHPRVRTSFQSSQMQPAGLCNPNVYSIQSTYLPVGVVSNSPSMLRLQLPCRHSPDKPTFSKSFNSTTDNSLHSVAANSPNSSADKYITAEVDNWHWQLTKSMLSFYGMMKQADDHYQKKTKLRNALFEVIKLVFPLSGLYIVGSSLNGFGSKTSDLDMCLMMTQLKFDQKHEAVGILQTLRKTLHQCRFLREMTLIRARVPILKFTDSVSGIECDLNINNSIGIRNTHLLNAYSQLDSRVGALVLFVKHWAKSQRINDASQQTLSSYSLALMAINYLQCGCSPPALPSLQVLYPDKFTCDDDIRMLQLGEVLPNFESANQQSVGVLFVGFLHYYALHFCYETTAISVRLGSTLPRDVVASHPAVSSNPGQWKYLCIEEPFDRSNTARCVYDENVFRRIINVFLHSYQILRDTHDVNNIINCPV